MPQVQADALHEQAHSGARAAANQGSICKEEDGETGALCLSLLLQSLSASARAQTNVVVCGSYFITAVPTLGAFDKGAQFP